MSVLSEQEQADARAWAKWFAAEEMPADDLRGALIEAVDHLPLEYLVKQYGPNARSVFGKEWATEVMEKARARFPAGELTEAMKRAAAPLAHRVEGGAS